MQKITFGIFLSLLILFPTMTQAGCCVQREGSDCYGLKTTQGVRCPTGYNTYTLECENLQFCPQYNGVVGAALDALTTGEVGQAEIRLGVGVLGRTTTTGLGEYIGLWYSFITGVVGILATIMIMWGGFKWLTSRGNSSIIGEAKEIIFSAIIGLFLALMSFSILNLINPALVNVGGGLSLSGIGDKNNETKKTNSHDTSDTNATPATNQNLPPGLGSGDPVANEEFVTKATAYWEGDGYGGSIPIDRIGAELRSLEQFLAGKADFVSVAMDLPSNLGSEYNGRYKYGSVLRIPSLEKLYNTSIPFVVVDTGSAFYGKGTSRIDIRTDSDELGNSGPLNNNNLTVFYTGNVYDNIPKTNPKK